MVRPLINRHNIRWAKDHYTVMHKRANELNALADTIRKVWPTAHVQICRDPRARKSAHGMGGIYLAVWDVPTNWLEILRKRGGY